MVKRWTTFSAFLDDGRICLTNNAAERALRGIAVGRRNLIMPGFWARRWRSPILSTRYAGVPRSSSPISFTTVVAI